MLESKPQQKESADYVQLVVESPPTPVPTKRNEYESIYATPADVKKDTSFDNKIPTIHPVKKEEFWSYVTERDIKVLQREYRVNLTLQNKWLIIDYFLIYYVIYVYRLFILEKTDELMLGLVQRIRHLIALETSYPVRITVIAINYNICNLIANHCFSLYFSHSFFLSR